LNLFSGVDAKKFLQGLCTNDMHNLKNPGDALAAALLTPKGRILAPIIIYLKSSAESGDNILVEVHKKSVAEIQRYLTMYRLRSKVTIKPIGVQCTVHLEPSEMVVQPMLAVKDPRSDILGTRILSSNTVGEFQAAFTLPQSFLTFSTLSSHRASNNRAYCDDW